MCKKLILLVSVVLVLDMVLISGAGAADPDLIGWWKLDEGSGNTATDLSASGNDGTINKTAGGGLGNGGSAWVDDPERGMVLSFNGDDGTGAYVRTDLILPAMTMENEFTWAFWVKQNSAQETNIATGARQHRSSSSNSRRQDSSSITTTAVTQRVLITIPSRVTYGSIRQSSRMERP